MTRKSKQEIFLVSKMVERAIVLAHENNVFSKVLDKMAGSNEMDIRGYQGVMDRNIGEQAAYRRMEDFLREWREIDSNSPEFREVSESTHCPNCGFELHGESVS